MLSVIWIDQNRLNTQFIKTFSKKSKVKFYIYNSLEEVSTFIIDDIDPSLIICDEALVFEEQCERLLGGRDNIYISCNEDFEQGPAFFTGCILKPFKPLSFESELLSLLG